MKYLNSISDLLMESIESYQWELTFDTDKQVNYKFNDILGNTYLVSFIRNSAKEDSYELTYYVHDKEQGYYSVSRVVNVNPYKTIQTVLGDILIDFINIRSPYKISLEGLSKDRERSYVSQRTKVYLRFLERSPINGYRMENFGNKINLIKI